MTAIASLRLLNRLQVPAMRCVAIELENKVGLCLSLSHSLSAPLPVSNGSLICIDRERAFWVSQVMLEPTTTMQTQTETTAKTTRKSNLFAKAATVTYGRGHCFAVIRAVLFQEELPSLLLSSTLHRCITTTCQTAGCLLVAAWTEQSFYRNRLFRNDCNNNMAFILNNELAGIFSHTELSMYYIWLHSVKLLTAT